MVRPDSPKHWNRFTTATGGIYEYYIENTVAGSPVDNELLFERMKCVAPSWVTVVSCVWL